MSMCVRAGACVLLGLAALAACAAVRVPALFSDGMVLQRERPIPVWGWAAPGETVRVTLGERAAAATAAEDGAWRVTLDPLPAGGPLELTVAGANTLTIKNVLLGEVWVCSGQSNMEWSVNGVRDAAQEIAAARYPQLRMFTVTKAIAADPQRDCKGTWVACTPETVGRFSAVGYFFARELQQELHLPIGVIHTSWGGTPAESWTDRATLEASPVLKPLLDSLATALSKYAEATYGQHAALWREWLAAVERAQAVKALLPPPPLPLPNDPRTQAGMPTGLYNAMVAPLIPYAIRGAIWYQGESNVSRAVQYRTLFPAMITGWRTAWGQGDFPFYFVQLANYLQVKPAPGESGWAELREAQAMTLALPNTAMATIIDIGEANDIHPKNKQDVGKRLALPALAKVYGRDLYDSGPVCTGMKIEGHKIRLRFTQMGGGLQARHNEPLTGFAIAGAEQPFVWASAAIEGDTVLVWHDAVAQPTAVRYAWADNPICNLINRAGLPASPFRTDGPVPLPSMQ